MPARWSAAGPRDVPRVGQSTSEIIVGSIRHIADINEAMQAGADILTVPPKFFPQMCGHPKTDEAVHQFVTEFAKWQRQTPTVPLKKSALKRLAFVFPRTPATRRQ